MMIPSGSQKQTRVLIVEDEADLQEAMVSWLNMEGLMADGVGSLQAATQWMTTHAFDVVVLDLGLPDGDGLEWLSSRADLHNKGVIITTARGESAHRISGVKAGADVYLVKPVLLEELTSLIHNLARRIRPETARTWILSTINWSIESPDGHSVKLTHSEHTLLSHLARFPGKAIPREELVIELGHDPDAYDARRMEIMVRRLRTKARDALGHTLPLETVHRCGYAFTAPIEFRHTV